MADHLGHGKNEPVENPAGNTRNGKSEKRLTGEFGELPIEIARDHHGNFEPQLIPKHQPPWSGFDDKILSLYSVIPPFLAANFRGDYPCPCQKPPNRKDRPPQSRPIRRMRPPE